MITDDTVIEIYSLADDFCKVFSKQLKQYQIERPKKSRSYYKKSTLSNAEVITILVLTTFRRTHVRIREYYKL